MLAHTVTIDRTGRVTLPKSVLEALNLKKESEILLEVTAAGILLTPKRPLPPITERIANMNLPAPDWEQMEAEIEAGR